MAFFSLPHEGLKKKEVLKQIKKSIRKQFASNKQPRILVTGIIKLVVLY